MLNPAEFGLEFKYSAVQRPELGVKRVTYLILLSLPIGNKPDVLAAVIFRLSLPLIKLPLDIVCSGFASDRLNVCSLSGIIILLPLDRIRKVLIETSP